MKTKTLLALVVVALTGLAVLAVLKGRSGRALAPPGNSRPAVATATPLGAVSKAPPPEPPGREALSFSEEDDGAPAEPQPKRLSPLTGRVLDWTSRAPIPDVQVSYDQQKTTTGPDGSFEILPVEVESYMVFLSASKAGYCSLYGHWVHDLVPESMDLELLPTFSVGGIVSDASGDPVVGARVSLQSGQEESRTSPYFDDLQEPWQVAAESRGFFPSPKTDEMGRFEAISAIPWTPCSLEVSHERYLTADLTLEGPNLPGDTLMQEIVLEAPTQTASIQGKVTVNDVPGSGTVFWNGLRQWGSSRIQKGGRYRIDGIAPGPVDIFVQLRDDKYFQADKNYRAHLNLAPHASRRHDFELEVILARIAGRVLRADGSPLIAPRRKRVTAKAGSGQGFSSRVARRGRFTITVPASEPEYELYVGAGVASIPFGPVAPGTEDVEIIIPATGTLRCRALSDVDRRILMTDIAWRPVGESPFRAVAFSHADWISLEVPVGEVDLLFRGDRSGHAPKILRNVRVEPSSTREIEVTLIPGIELRLTRSRGLPALDEHHAFLLEESEWDHFEYKNEEGRVRVDGNTLLPGFSWRERAVAFRGEQARIQGLLPGTYRFKVFPDDLVIRPETVVIPPGVTELEVTVAW